MGPYCNSACHAKSPSKNSETVQKLQDSKTYDLHLGETLSPKVSVQMRPTPRNRHENDWDCKADVKTDKYLTNCVCTRSVWSADRETDVRVSCDLRSQKESKGAGKMACMGGGVEGRAVRRREDVKVTACRSGIWPKMVWSAKTIPKG